MGREDAIRTQVISRVNLDKYCRSHDIGTLAALAFPRKRHWYTRCISACRPNDFIESFHDTPPNHRPSQPCPLKFCLQSLGRSECLPVPCSLMFLDLSSAGFGIETATSAYPSVSTDVLRDTHYLINHNRPPPTTTLRPPPSIISCLSSASATLPLKMFPVVFLACFATHALIHPVHAQTPTTSTPTSSWGFQAVQSPNCDILEPAANFTSVAFGDTVEMAWSCPDYNVFGGGWYCSCFNTPNSPAQAYVFGVNPPTVRGGGQSCPFISV